MGICSAICTTVRTSCRYAALNPDGWVLLYLGCCLLYAICATGHYSFHWLGPTILLEQGVIPLLVVLLVLCACVCYDWMYQSLFLAWGSFMGVMTNVFGFPLVS